MTTPDFLVIGAQKSGTTTLHEDLAGHPEIVMTRDKESSVLSSERLPAGPESWYHRQLPRELAPAQLAGEVSTTYSMRDKYPDATVNSLALGKTLKVVYITRNPIERAISHHHHDFGEGLCGPDINLEVAKHHELVNHSRYWYQLEPWLDAYGPANCHVIRFEDYVQDRQSEFDDLCRFLERSRHVLQTPQAIHNASTDKVVTPARWSLILRNDAYRTLIRPLVPTGLRKRLTKLLLPKAPPRPPGPSPQTLENLRCALSDDADSLSAFTHGRVQWDLTQTVRQISTDGRA